jgi:hypothetical protein
MEAVLSIFHVDKLERILNMSKSSNDLSKRNSKILLLHKPMAKPSFLNQITQQ